MKTKLLLLAGLFVLLVMTGLFWWSSRPAKGGMGEALTYTADTELAPVVDPLSASPDLQKPASAQEDAADQRELVPETDPELAEIQAARAPVGAGHPVQWIEGNVEWPEGTPADEAAEVEARGRPFEWDPRGRRVHRVPVARDGSFRVAVSTDTSAAILKLYGTYVYLRSNKAWKRDSDQPILLKPELGAAIDLYVAVPSQWALPPKGWTCNLTTPGSYMGSRQPGLVDGRRIEARGIAVDEYFLVNAWADGLAAQSYRAQELTPGEKRDVTLTFLPEARLVGTLLDKQGRPVPSGKVLVRSLDEANPYAIFDETGGSEVDQGAFEVRNLPPGDFNLTYRGLGFDVPELVVRGLQAGEVRNVALVADRGMLITGTVHWASGEPAVGATVKVLGLENNSFFSGHGPMSEAEADAEGRFELSGFQEVVSVGLLASGFPPGAAPPEDLSELGRRRWDRENRVLARMDQVRPSARPVAIVLGLEAGDLAGQVVDDQGEPIERFRITATPLLGKAASRKGGGMGAAEGVAAGVLRTNFQDPKGHFLLEGLPAGTWEVYASAMGYRDMPVQTVTIPSTKDVLLTLPRAASVRGTVVNSDEDVVETQVHIERVVAPDSGLDADRRSTKSTKLMGYGFSGLDAGRYRVWASTWEEGNTESEFVDLSVGDHRKDVTLHLPVPGALLGRVHPDWLGGTLDVRLEGPKEYEDSDRRNNDRIHVGEDGRFESKRLPAGTYVASLNRMGEGEGRRREQLALGLQQTIRIQAGQTTQVDFGAPGPESIVLSGRVLRAGEAVERVILTFEGSHDLPKVQCLSGEGGAYRVILPGADRYTIRPQQSGEYRTHVPMVLDVKGPSPVAYDIHLPDAKLILLPQLETGDPILGGYRARDFYLSAAGGSSAIAATSADNGRVVFDRLPPGEYRLTSRQIQPNGTQGGSHLVLLSPRTVVIAEDTPETEIRGVFGVGASLRGTVRGIPAEGPSRIAVFAFAGPEGNQSLGYAQAENGLYRFDSLPPGEVWVSTRWRGGNAGDRVRIELEAKTESVLDVDYLPN
ncbi:MAG: carboxypeptidase regulatory-like domain-containing protein [Planctomycetes bacterium]|nr:carboxypeptidase regulatory-like domain-containing protein [Planctomycetota bacterium]MCB9913090.1 carboxypeptidase regulatory-like domain-containing protein [Planctomycetota bacterium]